MQFNGESFEYLAEFMRWRTSGSKQMFIREE
jgi:hypothetical protein